MQNFGDGRLPEFDRGGDQTTEGNMDAMDFTLSPYLSPPHHSPAPATHAGGGAAGAEPGPRLADILVNTYNSLAAEDPGVYQEALNADAEEYNRQADLQLKRAQLQGGKVNRRAPLNPVRPEWRPGYTRKLQEGKVNNVKLPDPAKRHVPIHGKLLMCLGSTGVLLWIFFQSLLANKINLRRFYAPFAENNMVGPDGNTLLALGALNSNVIRHKKEWFRIFWANWMHSGWIHILVNLVSQIQFLWMIEPDWGFFRCFFVFAVAALVGNLSSLVCNPCSTTVGSSGGLFGLMGAVCVYAWEYWRSIPRPFLLILFTIVVAAISLILGFINTGTDNWAHLGGLVGGVLASLATIPEVPRDMCCQSRVSAERKAARVERQMMREESRTSNSVVSRRFSGRPASHGTRYSGCRCAPLETCLRLVSLVVLAVLIALGFLVFYKHYRYQPVGQPTFKSKGNCCCCDVDKAIEAEWNVTSDPWVCYACDREYIVGQTFQEYCDSHAARTGRK